MGHFWYGKLAKLVGLNDLSALPSASAMYHQQAPFLHQASIAIMADMVAQRLMENQAHHERAYADMYEQQFGPPPPAPALALSPAPYP